MSLHDGTTILFSMPRGEGVQLPEGNLFPSRIEEFRRCLGARVLEIKEEELPDTMSYVSTVGDDLIEQRDEVNQLIVDNIGLQILFLDPVVARVILCGNTGLEVEDAEDLIKVGIAMGFRAVLYSERCEGRKGTAQSVRETQRPIMIAHSTNPEEFAEQMVAAA